MNPAKPDAARKTRLPSLPAMRSTPTMRSDSPSSCAGARSRPRSYSRGPSRGSRRSIRRSTPVVAKHYDLARADVKARKLEGPFAGVPYLLKDLNVGLAGTVTTEGSVAFKGQVMDANSTITTRAKKAGMVVFGKTATPEFGLTVSTESTLFEPTRNPWNLAHSAGGSSGGAAAAVAARILPIANATDGGGSIRIPASCCGVFGLKPSRGRVPSGRRQGGGLERALRPARRVDQRAR